MALTQITTTGIANDAITADKLPTNLDLIDNQKIRFGTGNDLALYHNGTNSYLNNSTGFMWFGADNLLLTNAASSEYTAKFTANGSVELYHNNAKKLETTSVGAQITGRLVLDGGYLHISGSDLYIDDSRKAYFGAGSDLSIYHDGSNSYISNSTGQFAVQGDDLKLRSTTDLENYIVCTYNGSVDLYHNGSKKLETGSGGISVTGGINLTTNLSLLDNGIAKFGTGDDLQIKHDGNNSKITDSGTGILAIGGSAVYIESADHGETCAKFTQNGAVELYYDGVKKLESTSYGIKTAPYQQLGTSGTATANWHIGSENDGSFRFFNGNYGAGTEVLRLKYDGDLSIANGNLVVASGHGIDFSATSNTSNGTTTAELLDDYEYGSFTPFIEGSTGAGTVAYSAQNGFYIKIGRLVTVYVDFTVSSWSGATGIQRIGGFPFTKNELSSQNYYYEGVAHWYIANEITNSKPCYAGYMGDNAVLLNMYVGDTCQTGTTAPVNVTGRVSFSFTYSTSQ